MRIAFDLDTTLIEWGDMFPLETTMPFAPLRPWFKEPLRRGTRQLMQTLQSQGHDLWIYTTSGRDAAYLRFWFLLLGIRIGGVVNYQRHEKLLRAGHCPKCSKYPPAFGIDLLIDDSEGVFEEGSRHGFEVLLINPSDLNWAERVLAAVADRTRLI
jgi:hypothetical protein